MAGFSKWHLSAKAQSENDGKPDQRHLRPDFTGHIFIATSRCRKPNKCPPFWKSFGALDSGTRPSQRKACHRYWKLVLKKRAAPHFLGKGLTEAHHKLSRNLTKWVGFEEKQFTRTHTSTFWRACRALTALQLTGSVFGFIDK